MSNPIKLFLIEDSALLRERLAEMIAELPDIDIVGFAEDEDSAKEALVANPMDVVLVDLELKFGSGIGVLEALQGNPSQFHDPIPIVLTTYAHPRVLDYCRKLGARACFDKGRQMDACLAYISQSRSMIDEKADGGNNDFVRD